MEPTYETKIPKVSWRRWPILITNGVFSMNTSFNVSFIIVSVQSFTTDNSGEFVSTYHFISGTGSGYQINLSWSLLVDDVSINNQSNISLLQCIRRSSDMVGTGVDGFDVCHTYSNNTFVWSQEIHILWITYF